VYLYSTRDEPGASPTNRNSCILPPNSGGGKQSTVEFPSKIQNYTRDGEEAQVLENLEEDEEAEMDADDLLDDSEDNGDVLADEPESDDDRRSGSRIDVHPNAPVIYPRMRFSGHCNVETVKDGECSRKASMNAQWVIGDSSTVNYLGPYDEYVASGSDDGNFFIWKKSSGEVVDVLEGDDSIVNVIEGHPTLPLVAVSGIDTTIKVISSQICLDYPIESVTAVVCPCSRASDAFQIPRRHLDHQAECSCFEKRRQPLGQSTTCPSHNAPS
jgi:WD40 repeat protein